MSGFNNEAGRREFWRCWEIWWQLRTVSNPRFYSFPRRERQILGMFTQLFEMRTLSVQEAILKRGF